MNLQRMTIDNQHGKGVKCNEYPSDPSCKFILFQWKLILVYGLI